MARLLIWRGMLTQWTHTQTQIQSGVKLAR